MVSVVVQTTHIVLCHGCSLLTFAPGPVIDESQIRELAFLGRCPTLFSQQSGEERPSGVEKSRHWLSTVTSAFRPGDWNFGTF